MHVCVASLDYLLNTHLQQQCSRLLFTPLLQLAFMGEDGAGIGGGAAAGAAGAGAAEENAGVELDRGCAYYTCDTTRQLNTQYGDLQHKIQDLEVR